MRRIPYSPVFTTTPDMRADTWLGAAAWAGGSQKWSGMRPAFMPKPRRARRNTRVPAVPAAGIAATPARSKEPEAWCSSANTANRARVPTWVAAR